MNRDLAGLLRGIRLAFDADDVALWIVAGDRLVIDGERWQAVAQNAVRGLARRVAAEDDVVVREGYLGAPMWTVGGAVIGAILLGYAPGHRPALASDVFVRIAARIASEIDDRGHQRSTARAPVLDVLRDELGIHSRPFIHEVLLLDIARAVRAGRSLAVAVVDVGGVDGDRSMRESVRVLRQELRSGDVIGRYTDTSLAVILPETALDAATTALSRARDVLGSKIRVGIAAMDSGDDPAALLNRASSAARGTGEVRVATMAGGGADAALPLEAGQVIANTYKILHLIGEGGVGRVYRAEDMTLERQVAVKILRAELASDPAFLARFRSEASLLAAIQHPNLVQIFTYGDSPYGTFFAMELVEGETLSEAIVRNQKNGTYLPLARVLACMQQIGSALDRLHQGGVLHRDVKPDNIALDPFRDRAVLLDVGIANRLDRVGDAAGTPGFIAPEVLFGAGESAVSDVFSMAVTAFEALTFRHPWASFETDPSQLLAPPSEQPRSLSELRPELAAADPIFERSLSYKPAQRLSSAGELADALFAVLGQLVDELDMESPAKARDRFAAVGPPAVAVVTDRTVVDLDMVSTGPAQTRGVVFKALPRVVGHGFGRWLAVLREREHNAPLLEVLSGNSPGLGWNDASLFFDLLEAIETLAEVPGDLSRRYGRAVIRSSFQRFFPASASTLTPERIIAALPVVWSKYHTWGRLTATVSGTSARVSLDGVPRPTHAFAGWTEGLVGQTAILCGGEDAAAHVAETDGRSLAIEVSWKGVR